MQDLEQQKITLDNEVRQLATQSAQLSAEFAKQRVKVAALLAILERMQHDMPPVMAIRPGDAAAGAHTAMLLGATFRVSIRPRPTSRRLEHAANARRSAPPKADRRTEFRSRLEPPVASSINFSR